MFFSTLNHTEVLERIKAGFSGKAGTLAETRF